MAFLSSLFGATAPHNQATLVTWADKQMKTLGRVKNITPEVMFIGFIYSIVSYAREDMTSPKSAAPFKPFMNDSSLFELGCYVHFRVDLWLFVKHSEQRARISGSFSRDFIRLFAHVLEIQNVQELFYERLNKYAELARSHADPQKYYAHLAQCIFRTKNNQKPQAYGHGGHLDISSLSDLMALQMQLAVWETNIMPALIDSMEEALSAQG